MEFREWEPVYDAILADFGFDRTADEATRDRLAGMGAPDTWCDPGRLQLAGSTVAVAGAGPSLEAEVDRARAADTVLAASTAADRLRAVGIRVDGMVTDLDKNPDTVSELTAAGTPVAIHAHGDNVAAIEAVVPTLATKQVVPTTQARPADGVLNFGGFTDGDRAAFLADHFGAGRLTFLGWDFDDPAVGPEKRRKLRWAERLLYWLERRRGESFALLAGRRDGIDTTALPIE